MGLIFKKVSNLTINTGEPCNNGFMRMRYEQNIKQRQYNDIDALFEKERPMRRRMTKVEIEQRNIALIRRAIFLGALMCLGFTYLMFHIMGL